VTPGVRRCSASTARPSPPRAELDAWLHQRQEAERRDHRRLGRELDLFSIREEYGEGLILWHPKGGVGRKVMEDYLRDQLLERGYGLVYTPHIARRELWWTSGHEENFADSMFSPMASEETDFRLKPMNCPFHIGIYRSAPRSYRDLPIRLAELGTVYRAELAGTLHGLLRVRGFTQDDAHLFCTPETVCDEIVACLDFAFDVYKVFGFETYRVDLSVRGSDGNKHYAERVARALRQAGLRVELNARGDKIGAKIRDAQLQKVPFMLVVGDREAEGETVAVRERSRGKSGSCRSRSSKRWPSDSSDHERAKGYRDRERPS